MCIRDSLKSEYGQLNLQKTDLVKLIQDICITFEGQVPGIRFENTPETCQTFADAEQIETVLKNLLDKHSNILQRKMLRLKLV